MEKLVMPRANALMHSGFISEVFVKNGQYVPAGTPILSVEADKAILDLTAPCDGYVTVLCKTSEEYPVGAELAVFGATPAEVDAQALEKNDNQAEEKAVEAEASREKEHGHRTPGVGQLRILPIARRLINENGIDPSLLKGTGAGGAITKEDVLHYLDEQKRKQETVTEKDDEIVQMDAIRRSMLAHMVRCKEVVQATTFMEMDMSAVRQRRQLGKKCSYTSYIVKAVADAVRDNMDINCSLEGNNIVRHKHVNVGVALDMNGRLVVPVIKDADKLTVEDIETEITRFKDLAKGGSLPMEDLSGGTITVTNSGVFGSTFFAPVVNHPQTAIVGLPQIMERAVVRNHEIVIRPMITISLSYDHRIIEGSLAVGLLADIKKDLEMDN